MADLAKIECKIKDIKPVPNTTSQIVSVEFKLGDRQWFKGYRLNYDRPISMEEFKKEIVRVGVFPENEDDFLAFVKEEADQPFTVEVDRSETVNNAADNIDPPADS